MTSDLPRLSAVHAPDSAIEDADVLIRLQESALGLLASLDRAPKSLRIKAHGVEIELEWPERDPAVEPAAAGTDPAPHARSVTGHYLTAQTVGVFYRSPKPGAEPFVEVGDVIVPGQQVGIIEAMKLMIPVESDVAGDIVDVLASDGAQVEYGDRLFIVEPADG